MIRGILVYFLLVCCLLTKDGLSLALDTWVEKSSLSLEMSFEDSLEEDGSDDFFASEDFGPKLDLKQNDSYADKSIRDQYSQSALQVLLEQVIPPPRIA